MCSSKVFNYTSIYTQIFHLEICIYNILLYQYKHTYIKYRWWIELYISYIRFKMYNNYYHNSWLLRSRAENIFPIWFSLQLSDFRTNNNYTRIILLYNRHAAVRIVHISYIAPYIKCDLETLWIWIIFLCLRSPPLTTIPDTSHHYLVWESKRYMKNTIGLNNPFGYWSFFQDSFFFISLSRTVVWEIIL